MTTTRKIFLASSAELEDDRREFEVFINRKNKAWVSQGVFLELVLWEDFLDALSPTRLQDEYNRAIRACDVFVMLFFTKVGRYTEEEFGTAVGQFQATRRPFIFTYFKNAPNNAPRADLQSLWAFQDKLKALGHFQTQYHNTAELLLHFSQQLDKLVANGFIEFKPDQSAQAVPAGTSYQATLTGDGAIAQGAGATAVGAGAVLVGGRNTGNINTGTRIGGDLVHGEKILGDKVGTQIYAGGHSIGRDFIQIVAQLVQRGEDPGEFQAVIAHYLAALAGDLAGLKLGEIDVAASDTRREPLQLADVYVPLATQLNIPQETTLEQWLLRNRRPGPSERAGIETQRETRAVSTLEALSQHRQLTLLGAAGSGKSTFGASVLLTLAQVWQGHRDQLVNLGEQWTHGALLPIRVVLRRFAEQLPAGSGPVHAGDLWAFIGRDLDASGYGLSTETRKYVQRIARDRGALIVLDGLDECGSDATRQRVLGAVDELIRSAGQQCRFLLTARPYAWPGKADPAQGVYALADFNDEQIEQFIHAWYAALARRQWLSPGDADRKLADLLAARQRPDLLPLSHNPLLLTLMASLHANRGRLPDDRADLYNDSVDLLMLRWNRQIGADKALLDALAIPTLKLSDLREVLEELAFVVHAESVVHDRGLAADQAATSGAGGTADIGEGRLLQAFRPLLDESWDKAAVVVDYIEKRAGLLLGQGDRNGERQFAFPHRTFQEFLAACHLAARQDFASECTRLAREAPGHWQVVLPLAARIAKAERGASAADELIGGTPIADFCRKGTPDAADWTCALLAGMQLLEIGVGAIRQRDRTSAIARRVADWLAASLPLHPDNGGAASAQRARAGDVLAQLGDPRFDPQRFHLPADEMLGFVRIPADPGFMIGTRRSAVKRVSRSVGYDVPDYEINDAATPTPEFYLARYPVTVAQFRAFVEATGFAIGDADALADPDSRPVRWVSWHDAQAWCDWLNETLATSPACAGSPIARLVREQGWRVALPSELEWEKAARGGLGGSVFPWPGRADANRANYGDSQIGDTSVVGCFAANGFGLFDMVGNVWEWTRSIHLRYPYDSTDPKREDLKAADDVERVVRGGSWGLRRGLARCAARLRFHPGSRFDYFGFRVVLRSSPVS